MFHYFHPFKMHSSKKYIVFLQIFMFHVLYFKHVSHFHWLYFFYVLHSWAVLEYRFFFFFFFLVDRLGSTSCEAPSSESVKSIVAIVDPPKPELLASLLPWT